MLVVTFLPGVVRTLALRLTGVHTGTINAYEVEVLNDFLMEMHSNSGVRSR